MHQQLFSAGGSTLGDLLQALEDYLPVLLGLVKDGTQFRVFLRLVSFFINVSPDQLLAGHGREHSTT